MYEILETKERIIDISEHKKGEKYCTPSIKDFSERTRAFVKIEDGCDRFCSYCIIPKARGRVRWKPIEDIKTEVSALANNGYREIVLVGINLSAYGRGSDLDLADAVAEVSKNEKIERIRLGSLEPDHITDALIEKLAKCEKLFGLDNLSDPVNQEINHHILQALKANFLFMFFSVIPLVIDTAKASIDKANEVNKIDNALIFIPPSKL